MSVLCIYIFWASVRVYMETLSVIQLFYSCVKSYSTLLSWESSTETFGDEFLRPMCSWQQFIVPVGKYSLHLGNSCRSFITIKRYNQHTNCAPHWRTQLCVYFQTSFSRVYQGCEVRAAGSDLVNIPVHCEAGLWIFPLSFSTFFPLTFFFFWCVCVCRHTLYFCICL